MTGKKLILFSGPAVPKRLLPRSEERLALALFALLVIGKGVENLVKKIVMSKDNRRSHVRICGASLRPEQRDLCLFDPAGV